MQAGALFFAPAFLPGGIAANDRIRVGIAGVKGRGFALMRSLLEIGKDSNVEVAALCDVDSGSPVEAQGGVRKAQRRQTSGGRWPTCGG